MFRFQVSPMHADGLVCSGHAVSRPMTNTEPPPPPPPLPATSQYSGRTQAMAYHVMSCRILQAFSRGLLSKVEKGWVLALGQRGRSQCGRQRYTPATCE